MPSNRVPGKSYAAGEPEAQRDDYARGTQLGTAADPLLGTLLHGKYRILGRIGVGATGTVYEARDERGAGNRVAIKVLRADVVNAADLIKTFKGEAERITRLNHPNIVDWKVFDATEDGTQYLVMERLHGEELSDTIQREGVLEPDRAARLLLQVLEALRAAHHLADGGTILHLDLKPSNVYLCEARGRHPELAKVFDFGIGQFVGGEPAQRPIDVTGDELAVGEIGAADPLDDAALEAAALGSTADSTAFLEQLCSPTTLTFSMPDELEHTKSSFPVCCSCTPEYASPEQAVHIWGDGKLVPLDSRSDLYSLGVLGFQMVTGRLPFPRPEKRLEYLHLHIHHQPMKVAETGIKVPKALGRFIDRCLEKDREARWQDTDEAFEALDAIVNPPAWRRFAAIGGPVVGLLLALVVWLGMRDVAALPVLSFEGAQAGVWLGPKRPEVSLSLAPDATGKPARTDGPVQVLQAGTSAPLPGWSAAWEPDGRLRLSGPADEPGRIEARLHLKLAHDDYRLQELPVVWLGADSWSIPWVRIGAINLGDLRQRAIDPARLTLDVAVAGEGRHDLEEVIATLGDAPPRRMTEPFETKSEVQYALPLDKLVAEMAPPAGRATLTVVARDRAGAEIRSLRVVSTYDASPGDFAVPEGRSALRDPPRGRFRAGADP